MEKIPSMGGSKEGLDLRGYAADASDGTAIIELGTWLGAGTEKLIEGVEQSDRDVEIHGFDIFRIRGNEVEKAKRFGLEVADGQDSLPLVEQFLSGHKIKPVLHKGEILDCKWKGRRISLYIDDACKYKETFVPALKIFSPFFIPGKTIIILMDYFHYTQRPNDKELLFQQTFMRSHWYNFKLIEEKPKYTTAVFKYLGGLNL